MHTCIKAEHWNPVYTIQPVVQPVWQPAVSCNQTSNRLSSRFDNRVERTATVRSTGCQTGLYNWFDNRLYTRYNRLSNRFDNRLNVCIHNTTGCYTGFIVYTNIYSVVKPSDNRLYRVNGAWQSQNIMHCNRVKLRTVVMWIRLQHYNRVTSWIHRSTDHCIRDMSEFESESDCCLNPRFLQIWNATDFQRHSCGIWIFDFRFGKPFFIIHHSACKKLATQK